MTHSYTQHAHNHFYVLRIAIVTVSSKNRPLLTRRENLPWATLIRPEISKVALTLFKLNVFFHIKHQHQGQATLQLMKKNDFKSGYQHQTIRQQLPSGGLYPTANAKHYVVQKPTIQSDPTWFLQLNTVISSLCYQHLTLSSPFHATMPQQTNTPVNWFFFFHEKKKREKRETDRKRSGT